MSVLETDELRMSQDDFRISEQQERTIRSRLLRAKNIVDLTHRDYGEGVNRKFEISRWNPFFQLVRAFQIWFIYAELKEKDS